jgi:hypothetical protein
MAKKPAEPSLAELGLDEPVSPSTAPVVTPQSREPKANANSRTNPPPTESSVKSSSTIAASSNLSGDSKARVIKTSPMYGLLFTGTALLILGSAELIWYGSMETTVEEQLSGVTQRIYNTGLQQQQLIGFIAGVASWLGGLLTLVIRAAAKSLMNNR